MAYSYWKSGRQNEHTVFDAFFRKNPFRGEFTLFAGLEEVLRLVQSFKFTPEEIEYLRCVPAPPPWHCALCDCVPPLCSGHPSFVDADPRFFTEYLAAVDCSEVQIFAVKEGGVVFPREPLIRCAPHPSG